MPAAGGSERLCARALEILPRLIAFDTTSSLSNLALIDWAEAYLAWIYSLVQPDKFTV